MLKIVSAVAVSSFLVVTSAAAESKQAREPEEMIREGAERILEGMRGLIDRIPLFAPPELLPNGDIIIRRLPRGSERSWPRLGPEPGPDGSLRT